MRRVKPARYRQRILHVDRDPVAERHSKIHQISPAWDVPFGEIVNEDASARFEHPDHFRDPLFAPCQVRGLRNAVVHLRRIFLGEIERRIGKRQINRIGRKITQHPKGISLVEPAKFGLQFRNGQHSHQLTQECSGRNSEIPRNEFFDVWRETGLSSVATRKSCPQGSIESGNSKKIEFCNILLTNEFCFL